MSELVVTYSLPCDAMQNHQHPPLAVLSYAYVLRQQVLPSWLTKVATKGGQRILSGRDHVTR